MPGAIIKTIDLLDEIQLALLEDDLTDELAAYCNTLLFWISIHLKERYIVLNDRQAQMRLKLKGEVK